MTKKSENKRSPWISLLIHFCAAVAVALALVFGAKLFLNLFTRHAKELIVPDFSNLTLLEAQSLAEENHMRVEVTDSVFLKRMKKGAVYRQNPRAGSKVKDGRRIILTINAMTAKKVTMPNLIGYSMRQAMAELQSRGLVLGKLIYVDDIATNNVLKQLKGNREIDPGVMIESESVIDLVVGLNSGDSETYVPDVVGLKHISALDAVHANSLNISKLRFDKTVKDYDDSLSAVVYKQNPEPSEFSVKMGEDVTLYLTVDTDKVPAR